MSRQDILKRKENIYYKKLYEYSQYLDVVRDRGYKVAYIALKGSQNYNLEREDSDYDAVAVVYPSLEVLIDCGPKFSYTYVLKDGSRIVVKDVSSFLHDITKGFVGELELLTTPFALGDKDFFSLLDRHAKIIFETNVRSFQKNLKNMVGKINLFLKTPGKEYIEEVATYGYRRKNLLTLKRLLILYKNYLSNVPFYDMYICTDEERKELLDYYYNPLPEDEALREATKVTEELVDLIDKTRVEYKKGEEKINYSIRKIFNKYVFDQITKDVLYGNTKDNEESKEEL